ncbi:SAM-dependent methyltransferase [Flavimaricola marinus]|uniref:Cyclopropane-fatty-acyl-phospholipid synthase n=1 Tax=Flavimaricola marinus TaxID=1819565 RepID=A0A238LAJ0_9RHOB|nr:cyclopropane-fatty-acyl-phospholipid synthase family protein [Flavimaricola marinus]SMY05910.1 Cyclopropane-fatty-acyl-phospholipid synthase [Flavimaricola marinus]
MWQKLLLRFIGKTIRKGTLTITWPDGSVTSHGSGAPDMAISFTPNTDFRSLVLNPEVALGEAYSDGHLAIENDDLRGFLGFAVTNAQATGFGRFGRVVPWLKRAMRRINQHNGLVTSRKNVELTYDLSTDFYELWLDKDMQYTCAYYPSDDLSLDDAQIAKKDLIARKLRLEPGMRVLDIGSGWGGLSLTLARDYGVNVVGVTLSKVQLAYAKQRAKSEGLDHLIDFRLMDYRHVKEQFDRIVVVGMLEHVGRPQFQTFFRKMHENLKADGVAVVHTIGRSGPPNVTAPWIGKYIFPGCYTPAMSEVLSEVEKRGLIITDIEVLRLHYARTIRHWSDNFERNVETVRSMYDDRFVRMWRYYLAASEIGFTHMGNVIFQFQIAHDQAAVPLTRDYLLEPNETRFSEG